MRTVIREIYEYLRDAWKISKTSVIIEVLASILAIAMSTLTTFGILDIALMSTQLIATSATFGLTVAYFIRRYWMAVAILGWYVLMSLIRIFCPIF